MKKSMLCRCLSFALVLAVAGCQTPPVVNSGAGFELLTPSPATRKFIVAEDKPFAQQVAANNQICRALPGCHK